MRNIESVAELRRLIALKQLPVEKTLGVYRWWFKEAAANTLVSKIPNATIANCQTRVINGEKYVALYFGISKDLRGRIKWHICQNHTASAVKSGFLSTLRQTISALLNVDMTKSQDPVNKLMDECCYLEWEYTKGEKEAEGLETKELSQSQYVYPLNRAKNKTVSKEHVACLTKLRKEYRK